MKTTRGIEFDLEVTKVGHQSIDVLITCEEGSKVFTIEFPYPIQEDDTFYGQLLNGDASQLTDKDLSEAMAWVDEVTISFLSSEATKMCLSKTNDKEYWSVSLYTLEALQLHVFCHGLRNGFINGEQLFSEFAHTEQQAKDLLNKIR